MAESDEREISVEGKLTEQGVSAKVVSRAVSSFDRLVSNVSEIANAHLEGYSARRRAKTSAEVEFIKAVGKSAALKAAQNPEFVERAIEQHARSVLRKQENKDRVVEEAFSQLSVERGHTTDLDDETDVLNDEFLTRFEAYAEGASSEALRERWGKVLASEIVKPGTFSPKVLRVVDELDRDTAITFESLCQYVIGAVIPTPLSGLLSYEDEVALVDAGLLVDSGSMGVSLNLVTGRDDGGRETWNLIGENYVLGIIVEDKFLTTEMPIEREKLHSVSGQLKLPVYNLTKAGAALASIVGNDELEALRRLGNVLHSTVPQASIYLYKREKMAGRARVIETIFDSE